MCIVVQFVSGSGRSFCKILYTNPTQAGTIIITMATLLLSIYKGNLVVRSSYCNTDFRDTQSFSQRVLQKAWTMRFVVQTFRTNLMLQTGDYKFYIYRLRILTTA